MSDPAAAAPVDGGRVCLVTGAGRGIGREVARALSAAGHRVALTARSADQLDETAAALRAAGGGPCLVAVDDLTDPAAPDRVVGRVEAEWGPVDVLVANAGAAASARLERTTDELWDGMLALNLTAPFRCVRRTVPGMVGRGWGRVIVVASVASKVGAPYISAYTAAKHGVLGLVRAVAAETAGTGVTVNAVCPGYVDTPMTDVSVANIAARTGVDADQARERLARVQPIGRLIRPDEVARAVLFLVGEDGITGQGLNVDGGAVTS